jgi:hypothetical protein
MKNIYKAWKTTLLGTLLMVCAVCYIIGSWHYESEIDRVIVLSFFIVGGMLWLSPDTLIKAAKTFINKKSKEI